MGVLDDFGHGRLAAFRTSPLPLVVVYAEYEGRPQPVVPSRFNGSVVDAIHEWVFGVDLAGNVVFEGSVVDFFQRQLGITLTPIGGQRVWRISILEKEFLKDGEVIDSDFLRGFVKSKLDEVLSAENISLSDSDADLDQLLESPAGDPVGPQTPAAPPEILVLALDNLGTGGGQTGGTNPPAVAVHRLDHHVRWTGVVSGLSANSGVMAMCHELLHQFGTEDLYGAGHKRNRQATTMAAVPKDPDVRVRLDPWHELQLGVTIPLVADLTNPGSARLEHAGGDANRRALLLTDPQRRFEGFLVQLRVGPRDPIDRGGPDGWCVWHASLGAPGGTMLTVLSRTVPGGLDASVNVLGSPDLERGTNSVWPASSKPVTTPELQWWNGSETGAFLTLTADPDGLGGTVAWKLDPGSWRQVAPTPVVTVVGAAPWVSGPVVAHDPVTGWPIVAGLDPAQHLRALLFVDEQATAPWGWPDRVGPATDVAMVTRPDGIAAAFTMSSGWILVDYPPWFAGPTEIHAPGVRGRPAITVWRDLLVVAWTDGSRLWVAERSRLDVSWRVEVVSMAAEFPPPAPNTGVALASTVDDGGACFLAWTGTDQTVRILRRGTGGEWNARWMIDHGEQVPAVLPAEGGFRTSETPAMALGRDGAIWFAYPTTHLPTKVAYGRAPAALGLLERKKQEWHPLWRQVDLGPIVGPVSIAPNPTGLTLAWRADEGGPARLTTRAIDDPRIRVAPAAPPGP